LLIVVAIIAILASVVFIALDPLTRFQEARYSTRVSDAEFITSALRFYQLDNDGIHLPAVKDLIVGDVYMLGTDSAGCTNYNDACTTNVDVASCVDVSTLVADEYLGSVPVSPPGTAEWTTGHTGYTLTLNPKGSITVRACESEGEDEIVITR